MDHRIATATWKLFVFAFLIPYSIQQEGADDCLCSVPVPLRKPCIAGVELTQSQCEAAGCCYREAVRKISLPGLSPNCYARKINCDGQCPRVPRNRRTPCGYWSAGRGICASFNCCYDHRIFPYCYFDRGTEFEIPTLQTIAPPTNTQPTTVPPVTLPPATVPTVTILPNQTDEEAFISQDAIEVELIGPEENFFNPETKNIIQVNCDANSERQRCGTHEITKSECVASKCCWSYSGDLPSCFHTINSSDTEAILIDNLTVQLQEYVTDDITVNDELVAMSPITIYDYGRFSVNVQCGIDNDLVQRCEAKTRKRCIDQACCWNGNTCNAASTSFNDGFDATDINFGLLENAFLADYWVPSLFEIVIDTLQDMNYILSCSGFTSIQCGLAGISRSECVSLGCCWAPSFIFDETTDSFCVSPLLTQTTNTTVRDEPLNWNGWGSWGECRSVSPCSNIGTKTRSRACGTATDKRGSCIGNSVEVEECVEPTVCVFAKWNQWGSWSQCAAQCNPARQQRQRECLVVEFEEIGCGNEFDLESLPFETQSQECNSMSCRLWDVWSQFTSCNAPCRGTGTMTRQRICLSGEDINLQRRDCYVQEEQCNGILTCPPEWSSWGSWSTCSDPCTIGQQTRRRQCQSDDGEIIRDVSCEVFGGLPINQISCNQEFCANWSEWVNDGECNAGCEEIGTQRTTRQCSDGRLFNIEPEECHVRLEECTGEVCRGNWAAWNTWATCDNQCGPSVTRRYRECILFGEVTADLSRCDVGVDDLLDSDERECNIFLCSSWGDWQLQGDCTALCRARGFETRARNCTSNIEVRKQITFEENENILSRHPLECYTERVQCIGPATCPSTWNDWSSWSSCSNECTVGVRSRSRTCENYQGRVADDCTGSGTETLSCNLDSCLLWGEYNTPLCEGPCDVRIFVDSSRECLVPASDISTINQNCFRQRRLCEAVPCVAEWSAWFAWTSCTNDCLNSTRQRRRDCVLRGESIESNFCSGQVSETERCVDFSCDSYDDWVEAPCTGICGRRSTRPRLRNCFRGPNLINLTEIETSVPRNCYMQSVSCIVICLPSWQDWSSWSECSRSCELGSRRRNRQCFFDGNPTDPSRCSGIANSTAVENDGTYELDSCNSDSCLQWSEWVNGNCSAPCRQNGNLQRTRTCLSMDETQNDSNFGLCSSQTISCIGKCFQNWSEWGSWSKCTGRCGPGTEFQTRFCSRNGQVIRTSECTKNLIAGIEEFRRTRECNLDLCDSWTQWTNGECSKTCGGGGMFNRTRQCVGVGSIIPADNGESCTSTVERCGEERCPDKYADWMKWSACTQSCGEGSQRRRRLCVTNEGEQVHVNNCVKLGSPFQRQRCNPTGCRQWSTWSVGECSVLCGGRGTRARRRRCTLESEDIGISRATFRCYRIVTRCNEGACNGEWSDPSVISDCSTRCGPGLRYRVKQCKDPATRQRISEGRCVGEAPRLSNGMPCRGSDCG